MLPISYKSQFEEIEKSEFVEMIRIEILPI
jgi:hypothetical protein